LEQGQVDQWLDWTGYELEAPLVPLILPIFGIHPHDHERSHKAKEDLKHSVSILEKHLTGKTFLVGNHLTIADVVVASSLFVVYRYLWEENVRKQYPNVTRFYENVASNPHW